MTELYIAKNPDDYDDKNGNSNTPTIQETK